MERGRGLGVAQGPRRSSCRSRDLSEATELATRGLAGQRSRQRGQQVPRPRGLGEHGTVQSSRKARGRGFGEQGKGPGDKVSGDTLF